MELQNLDMVTRYAEALKRVRLGIAAIQVMPPIDEETRVIREITIKPDPFLEPYIYVGTDLHVVPIFKKLAIDCLLEQEKYLEKRLEELGVKAR